MGWLLVLCQHGSCAMLPIANRQAAMLPMWRGQTQTSLGSHPFLVSRSTLWSAICEVPLAIRHVKKTSLGWPDIQEINKNKKMLRYLNQTLVFAPHKNTARCTVFPIDFERLSFCRMRINYYILIRSLMTEISAENKFLLLLRIETFFGKEINFSKFTIY